MRIFSILLILLIVGLIVPQVSATEIEASKEIDKIQHSNNNEVSTDSFYPKNVKEIQIYLPKSDSYTGSWTVYFQAKCQTMGSYARPEGCADAYSIATHAQIYKNGKPWGAEHLIATSSYPAEYEIRTEMFDNISVYGGDKIQIYVWNHDQTKKVDTYIRDFGIIFDAKTPWWQKLIDNPPKSEEFVNPEPETRPRDYEVYIPREPFENLDRREKRERLIPYNQNVLYKFSSKDITVYELGVVSGISEDTTVAVVEDLKGLPVAVKVPASGIVYRYVNVHTGLRVLNQATVRFRVNSNWVNNNADKTISLRRWNGNSWDDLRTIAIGRDSRYVYYESITPELAHFAITATQINPAVTPVTTTVVPTPVFNKPFVGMKTLTQKTGDSQNTLLDFIKKIFEGLL